MVTITLTPAGRWMFRKTYDLVIDSKIGVLKLTDLDRRTAFAKLSEVTIHCTLEGIPFTLNGEQAGRTEGVL